MRFIPVGVPDIDETELAEVSKVVKAGWIARGKELEQFEQELAKYVGVKHAVAVSSGTAAIEIALRSLGIQGKEVITTTISCAPTANAIVHSGNLPVMVDVLRGSYNLNPAEVERHITKNTAALLPVHIYGRPADMTALMAIAQQYNLPVIEDVAQAMGARWQGKITGSFGKVGCFSLNVNKIITTGEGGFITTDDDAIAAKARIIRNYGRDPSGSDYCYTEFGYNFKFTNLQAAIGLAQLHKIDSLIAARRKNATYLRLLLQDVPGVWLATEGKNEFSVYFSFTIVFQKEGVRDGVKAFLEKKGIEVRTVFRPMCEQPYYIQKFGKVDEQFPNASFIGENGLYVGCYPRLNQEQMGYMAQSIREALHAATH